MLIPMFSSDASDISANPEFRYRTYKDRIGYTTFMIHNSSEISSQSAGLAIDRYIGFKDAGDERLLFYDQFGGGEVVYVTSNFRPPSPWAKLFLIDYQGMPIGSETYPVLFIPKNCFMQRNWKIAKYPMMGRQNGPYECQILTSPITMLGLFWIHSRSVSSNESFQVVWLYSTLLSIPIAKLSMSAENTGEVEITTTLISRFSEYPFIGELHVIEENR
jgi:hypothetical protein